MWLDPKGSAPARAVIWTDLHSPRAQLDEIPGFCAASLLVDRSTGRAATAVTYADRDAVQAARHARSWTRSPTRPSPASKAGRTSTTATFRSAGSSRRSGPTRASIAWELVAGGNHVQVYGHVYPSTPDVPFTVEVTDRTGAAEHMSALTDAEGEVRIDFALQDGRYSLQAFTASTRSLAEAESDIRTLELPAR